MPSVLSRPLFRQTGGEIAEPEQGFVERATQGVRRWDLLTNGEERRHRAQLDIYNNFTPEQRRHVGLLTETGLSAEDAIFQVWSEAKRGVGSDMLYPSPPPVAPRVSPEPMPPIRSEPLPPMPPMVTPAPLPPMVSPAPLSPMPPMVTPAPSDFSEFNQGGPALAPQAMMAPPMGMPPEAMMAPPTAMPPEAMGMPPEAMGMPPEAMGMPAGISPEDEALLGGVAQLGEDYVHDMMSGLETADTPESLINALRGNDLPLEARYDELAQLVGPEDAQATPESVLALVQPTIMLVDAGVGSLMPGVAGETEMMTESGAPTPMGEGVGNLMMAGAPPPDMMMAGAPPPDMMMANQVSPQGFWRGGPVVQRFQDGQGVKKNLTGETLSGFLETSPLEDVASLRKYVEQTSPLVSELLMPRRSREQDLQLAFYQGLGKFGQRLASPEEGQRGLSFGAAVGAALPDIIAPVIETGKQQAVTEREMNAVALQLAAEERKGDIASATTLTSALSKYFSDKYQLQNIDGKVIAVNKRNPADFYEVGDFKKPIYKTVNDKVVQISPSGDITKIKDFSDAETGEDIWGSSRDAKIAEFIAENKDDVIAWGEGTLQDPQLANLIEGAIYERAKRSVDAVTGNLQEFQVQPWVEAAIKAKYGESSQDPDPQRVLYLTGRLGEKIKAQNGGSATISGIPKKRASGGPVVKKFKDGLGVNADSPPLDPSLQERGGDIISGRYNPELAAGVKLPFHTAANWFVGQLHDVGLADGDLPFQETAGAKIELESLKGATSRFFTEGGDRTLKPEYDNLQKEIQAMGGFRTDASLLLKLKQIKESIQTRLASLEHSLLVEGETTRAAGSTKAAGLAFAEGPLTQTKHQYGDAIRKSALGRDLLKEYDRAINMLEGHLTGDRRSISEILQSIEGP